MAEIIHAAGHDSIPGELRAICNNQPVADAMSPARFTEVTCEACQNDPWVASVLQNGLPVGPPAQYVRLTERELNEPTSGTNYFQ